MAKDFYKEWLGIPEEFRPPTHYELLGLDPLEADRDRIDQATRDRMRIVQRYQVGKYADASVQLMMELSIARAELLNAMTKSRYDASMDETIAAEPVVPEEEAEGQLDVFKSIVEMAVFRGGIGKEHVPMLEDEAERLDVPVKVAAEIIDGTFAEREQRARRHRWIGITGAAAVVVLFGVFAANEMWQARKARLLQAALAKVHQLRTKAESLRDQGKFAEAKLFYERALLAVDGLPEGRRKSRPDLLAALESDDIRLGSDERYTKFEGRWITKKEKDAILEERFRAEQMAKGLVEFRGKWVRPEEREQVLQKEEVLKAGGYQNFDGVWLKAGQVFSAGEFEGLVRSQAGEEKLHELMSKACSRGKGSYSQLAKVFVVPADKDRYGVFSDYGKGSMSTYKGHSLPKTPYWVYVYPYWFVWERSGK